MADPSPGRDGVEWIADRLKELQGQVRDLQAPSGTQIYNSVSKLAAMIDDIQAQLDAWTATRYTNTQIDSKDAAVAAQISPAIASAMSGPINNGTSGTVRTGDLYAAQAPGFNITGTRVSAWIQSADGRLGTASSSRRYKQDIADAGIDPQVVYRMTPRQFRYIEQVEEHGDAAAVESGFIAEELEELGLTPWVVYRDVDGDVIPDGVSYPMLVVAQQAAIRDLNRRLEALEEKS